MTFPYAYMTFPRGKLCLYIEIFGIRIRTRYIVLSYVCSVVYSSLYTNSICNFAVLPGNYERYRFVKFRRISSTVLSRISSNECMTVLDWSKSFMDFYHLFLFPSIVKTLYSECKWEKLCAFEITRRSNNERIESFLLSADSLHVEDRWYGMKLVEYSKDSGFLWRSSE